MSDDSNKKIYEIGFHFLPTLSEEEASKAYAALKDGLATMGAAIIADQQPAMMNLAYPIGKEIENKIRRFATAYFGWVKFEIEGSAIESVEEAMEKNPNVLRFLLVKTVRESTLATPKLAHRGMSRRVPADVDAALPMDEAAVDKKIDEMMEEDAAAAALPKED